MSKPALTFGVVKVLLAMMIPFNVVGLFGCVSSMPRFCNSLAGSVLSGVAIAEAQRKNSASRVLALAPAQVLEV
jgi:uncharacterized membrane protein YccC